MHSGAGVLSFVNRPPPLPTKRLPSNQLHEIRYVSLIPFFACTLCIAALKAISCRQHQRVFDVLCVYHVFPLLLRLHWEGNTFDILFQVRSESDENSLIVLSGVVDDPSYKHASCIIDMLGGADM